MKTYKPTYCLATVVLIIQAFLIIFAGAIPVCVILAIHNNTDNIVTNILSFLVMGIGVVLALILVCFVVNTFMQNVAKESLEMNDGYIKYDNREIEINNIDKMSLFLGSAGDFNSKPCSLRIEIHGKEHLIIERPSFLFLIRLKKLCNNKEFIIEDLKKRIFIYPLIGFIVGILFGLYLLTL